MRNLLFIAVFLFSATMQLSANDEPKNSTLYIPGNEKSVVLNLVGPETEAEFLTITDARGDIVFKDKIETNKQRIKYDLWKLPNDNYTIKVEGDQFVEYHQVLISNDLISLVSSETYSRPVVQNLNKKIIVNASSTNEEDIQLIIVDQTGQVVYAFNEKKQGNYKKAFNLEHLEVGTYNVIISTDHFSNEIKISL